MSTTLDKFFFVDPRSDEILRESKRNYSKFLKLSRAHNAKIRRSKAGEVVKYDPELKVLYNKLFSEKWP